MNAFKQELTQTLKLLFAGTLIIPKTLKRWYDEGYPEVEPSPRERAIRKLMEKLLRREKELLRSEKAMEQAEAVQAMVDRVIKERERRKKSQAGGRGGRLGRKSQTGEGSGRLGRKNQARKPISKH